MRAIKKYIKILLPAGLLDIFITLASMTVLKGYLEGNSWMDSAVVILLLGLTSFRGGIFSGKISDGIKSGFIYFYIWNSLILMSPFTLYYVANGEFLLSQVLLGLFISSLIWLPFVFVISYLFSALGKHSFMK